MRYWFCVVRHANSMSDVEDIKNRISVVDLVGEYVRLQKAGSAWRALCPFHNEKTPSFMVSEERRSFHCFGCGKGGDIFTFVMEMEGLEFREALEQLAQKAGIELKRFEKGDKEKESVKPKLYNILELAAKWYEKNLWEGRGKEKILGYLRGRGLEDETIKKFRLGYAPEGWRNLLEFLKKKNFSVADIAKTGLLVEKGFEKKIPNSKYQAQDTKYYDRFRDRIVFPVQDIMGRVVGFAARVAPGGDEKTAKYINTPQTELYDKSKVLYGLNFAKTEIKKRDEVVLVEGNMDVIASQQAGFQNTIAVSGTAFGPEQIKVIKRYTENIKMAFDMDPAGQAAARKSARVCLENDLNVRIVLLPKEKDAADIVREDKAVWKMSVEGAREVVEYFFEDAFSRHDPKKSSDKKKIAKELLNVIKDIANPVEKGHWIKTLAEKLGVGESALVEILKKARSEPKPAIRGKENAILQSAGKEKAVERRIIGLLFVFPGETDKQRETINPNNFSGETERRIIEKLKKEGQEKNSEKIKSLVFDFEAQRLIDEAVFEVEVERDENGITFPEEDLKEALKRQRNMMIRESRAEFSKKIKEAEKAGDKKTAKALLQEFQDLSSQPGE
ncbi:MAG: DNA primase [Candidatus Moranbacteria bacterium RIFOXYA1_FULL_44_8]|nr:MAG: DNA primase [Candidatus Moranbacteria bacterium RIFOXYA1_FULL_44_8]